MLHLLNSAKFKAGEDRWVWNAADRGEFSVANVRKQINKQDGVGIEEEWKHWNHWMPPKINYFTWRTTLHKIPVKQELIRRGIPVSNPLCSRCEIREESAGHLICECTMSKSVWRNVLVWLKLPLSNEIRSCNEALEFVKGLTGFVK
ncbi:uncharacterized protein LOC118490487 [Helianthus annuus]|uniref:uncharacterized protein LOC118490487 n=1 Tax=Helianthus annuus TaxID=4232 RepID=UPI00165321C1|nr:uncharacterized protein LOC118490487 [Helianthus annuus]